MDMNLSLISVFDRMSTLNSHYGGRHASSSNLRSASGQSSVPMGGSIKHKASATLTPSAPNGQPLRHVKSSAGLTQCGKSQYNSNNVGRRGLENVEDVEDSPRIKRMRIDSRAAAVERNGQGEQDCVNDT